MMRKSAGWSVQATHREVCMLINMLHGYWGNELLHLTIIPESTDDCSILEASSATNSGVTSSSL